MRSPRLILPALLVAALAVPAAAADKPPTNSRVDDGYGTSGNRTVLKLKVSNAVKGTTAKVSCKGGKKKGCPKPVRGKTKKIKAKKAGTMSLKKALGGNKLSKGAKVTILLTDPAALARKYVFEVTGRFEVASQSTCEQPDGSFVACPR